MARIKTGLVLAAALFFFCLVYAHVEHGLNGPWYWRWPYRNPPLPGAKVYLPMLFGVLPVLGAQLLNRNRISPRIVALFALMLGCFGLKLAAILYRTDPPSFDIVWAIVEQPQMTSYYTDAASVKDRPLREWVHDYPRLIERFHLHSQSKPPGPVLYWWAMIQLMGDNHTASRVGGLLLGALATLSIPATYLLLRLVLQDDPAAFCGASFMALCPGFVLFFPMMDPVYPLISTVMLGCWFVALRDDRAMASVGLGLTLAATLLISFSTLVLGAFMIGLIFIVPEQRLLRDRLRIAARQAGIAMGVTIVAMVAMWVVIGYDPIATFLSAWHHQHNLLATYADQRPYPRTILFDLTDFALGTGWISFLLALGYFIALRQDRRHGRLVLLALSQIALVAVTGLLQSETSRVWSFMLPLLMIPVGLELARWPLPARVACLTALALLTAVIHQNMQFLY